MGRREASLEAGLHGGRKPAAEIHARQGIAGRPWSRFHDLSRFAGDSSKEAGQLLPAGEGGDGGWAGWGGARGRRRRTRYGAPFARWRLAA
jgi:hypothetical protein